MDRLLWVNMNIRRRNGSDVARRRWTSNPADMAPSRLHRLRRRAAKEDRPDIWQRGTVITTFLSVVLVGVGLWQQQNSAQEQQELALKGQKADRFVRVIDQLGQEGGGKLGVRLGAIYALEVLMRDFAEDENTVIEVLSAFVRSHAPWGENNKAIPAATPDVRAALTVLGRRPEPDKHVSLDLSNTSLGMDFFSLNNAAFQHTDLSSSDFSEADLAGADLRGSNLDDAYFDKADLAGSNLEGASLRGISLQGANLSSASLKNADFEDADLTGANLINADLSFSTQGSSNDSRAVTSAQLKCAKVDSSTILPSGVVPPAADASGTKDCQIDD